MKTSFPNKYKYSKLSLLISAVIGLHSTIAFADEAADQAKAKEEKGLEVIIVTAQKRIQNLQEVPVSVTAITGDEMAESVIKDMYDLKTNVPGLGAFQSQSATNSSFSIRGVGTSSQNFGLESSVGLYVDGVYRARQNSIINNLVDVEAVEVLRGPQGTLFGKNTPSGAILIQTVKPSHDGEDGFFEATAGNFGLINFSGATSISAIDNILAFRVTAFSSNRDGIVDDIKLGKNKLNDRNRWGTRLQALYTPSDDLSIRIIADYSEIDEVCCAAPVQLSNFQATGIPGKFGSDALLSGPPFNATVFDGANFFDRKVALSFLPKSTMKDRGLSAEINWDLNDNYSLVAISAYRKFNSFDNIDADFTDANLFSTTNDSQQHSFSQEVRLDYVSKDLNYIVGAYYFTQNLDLDYSLSTDQFFNEFFLANFNGALDPLFGGINALSAATGGLIAPTAVAAPANTNFNHTAKQKHESYALFSQFDYTFTNNLTFTAGIRYTHEVKDLSTVFTEELASGTEFPTFFSSIGATNPVPGTLVYGAGVAGAMLGAVGAGLLSPFDPSFLQAIAPFQTDGWGFNALAAITAARPDIKEQLKDDQVTGTAKLSYQYNDDTMMYASFGTGYKSGGTNTDRIAIGLNPIFNAEKSKSYEIGLKKDFVEQNLRFNMAVYKTTVSDFQANTFTGAGFNLQNAGDFKIDGFEIESTWWPVDTIEVNLSYAYVDATYKTFKRGNCYNAYTFHTGLADPGQESTDPLNPNGFCNRTGDRPAGEPKNVVIFKIKKDFNISDDIFAYVQADYNYTSNMVLDGSNDPFTIQDSYNVMNARLFFNFENYDMDVILWGRNILNENYINGTDFNTPLQNGKLNAYVSEPATYGITVKKRF
ncbi:MAG: TonB-dependent receptor [Gammaproteobacteria bacterium]|nr:MAG: TonB-dependent receptor [Gammaproteobacteria bacterium]